MTNMASTAVADLYCDVPPPVRQTWRDLIPGLMIVALGTLAAGFMSDHYGAPLTVMALLFGLALNFLSTDDRLTAGLTFASRSLLRWAIVLVGARVTGAQIAGLGVLAFLYIVMIVAATIGVGILAARRLGFGTWFGVLAGGSVAICGASAALALATTLGERRTNEAQLALVLVGISAMSAMAMMVYPIIAHALMLSNSHAGFFLGAAIHDVAQALGAGYSYSEAAGQIATIVKLTRVALLAPVLTAVALFLPRESRQTMGGGIPWFVIGFFVMAGVNSTGVIPEAVSFAATMAAAALLAAAVTATAIRSPLPKLLEAGIRPLLVVFAATVTIFVLALAAAMLLIR